MQKKPKVVIVGGGYGGVRVALDLLKKKSADVILIDKNTYHVLPAQYYELGALFRTEPKHETIRRLRGDFQDYFYSAAIPFEDIFHKYAQIKILRASVRHVVPRENALILEDGRRISYDWLVVGIGSRTHYFDIPHLESNSIGFKKIEDVLNIRNRIDELFLSSPKNKKITVVIGGGGFTGSELAGELVGYMKKLSHLHARPVGNWECIMVEAGHTILGTSSEWIQRKAKKRLLGLGVTFLFDSPIVDVWPNLLYIGNERKPFPFDVLVWTAGVKGACEGDIIEGVVLAKKNCLPPSPTLRVEPYDNVFTVGDVAATEDPKTKTPMPMTAQKAIHEAQYVARAIGALIKNKNAKLESYVPRQSQFIIPLGGKYALLEAGPLRASGFFVWVLKYVILLRYLLSLMPTTRAVRFLTYEIQLYTKND